LGEIRRFHRVATSLLRDGAAADDDLGDLLDAHRFSIAFRDWYFLPLVGAIWSCPTEQMLRFSAAPVLRYCVDNELLRIGGRRQWRSVRGGAASYVDRMLDAMPDARLATPVRGVRRLPTGGAEVTTAKGSERFDAVVLACHSDQALALLADPTEAEREVLGAIRWQRNRAILHTDARGLPGRK